ncbi:MAG: phosphatase PAP2 family protein [Ktedonobacteraceae bacterium]
MSRENDNEIPTIAKEEAASDQQQSAGKSGEVAENIQQQSADKIGEVVKNVQQEVQVARQPWYGVLRQTRFLLLVYTILLAVFGGLAFWVSLHPVLSLDIAISQEFQESKFPWLKSLMVAVSYQGNTLWLAIGLIAIAAVGLWLLHFRLEAVILLVVNVTSALLNVGLKLLINRPRPTEPLVNILQHATGQSFPSGHVMAYVAFWGLIFFFTLILFQGGRWWRVALLIFSGLVIVLVGPSRIYLGDHWSSDVLGSYLIGALWGWAWLWLYLRLKARGVLAASHKSDRPGAMEVHGKQR